MSATVSSSTLLRVGEPVAVQLAQLPHPVAHGLRVHEERRPRPRRGGPGAAARRAASPPASRRAASRSSASGASTCARRSASAAGRRRGPARQVRLGVERPSPAPSRSARSARSYDARTSSHGRAGPTTASRPAQRAQQAAAARPAASGTSSTRELGGLEPGHVLGRLQRAGVELGEHGRALRARAGARRSASRRLPVGALGGRLQRVVGRRRAAALASAARGALPHPARRRQLVGVPGDAGRGQLVDVGEDQLGELRDRRRPAARRAPPAPLSSRQATRAPTR